MKRFLKLRIGGYDLEIKDYKYKNRPPVSVRISGTTLGECKNHLGEACYFYKNMEAMSLEEGLKIGKQIILGRV